jgi:hypothetical protein
MDNKILLIVTICSSLFALLTPMTVHDYKSNQKDSTTIKAEKYLHELEQENNKKIEILKHDVDSLLTLKKKVKYIYIIKDSL